MRKYVSESGTAYGVLATWKLAEATKISLSLSDETFRARNGSRYRRIGILKTDSEDHYAAFPNGGALSKTTVIAEDGIEITVRASVQVDGDLESIGGTERLEVIETRRDPGAEAACGWWNEGPFGPDSNYPDWYTARGTFQEPQWMGEYEPGEPCFGIAFGDKRANGDIGIAVRHRGIVSLGKAVACGNGRYSGIAVTRDRLGRKTGLFRLNHAKTARILDPVVSWGAIEDEGCEWIVDMAREDLDEGAIPPELVRQCELAYAEA